MATQGYSTQQQREAERLVAISDRWAEGYDHKRGVRFVSFASRTTPGVFYYTRIDGRGCTCPGARESRSGRCFHQLACQIKTEQARERMTARPSYDSLLDHHLVDAF